MSRDRFRDDVLQVMLVIRPDIPILILTGFSERISDEQAHAMGIQGFLMKPVVLSHLSQAIRRALNGNASS